MTIAGVSPTLSIIYVPDYVHPTERIAATVAVTAQMERLFPQFTISLAVAEGPFEDTSGISSHFDGATLHGKPRKKQVAGFRVDYQAAMAKLCRHLCNHAPRNLDWSWSGGDCMLWFWKGAYVGIDSSK